MAKSGPERLVEDKGIHVNIFDFYIIQPTTGSIATIAWKFLILLQVISTPVLCLSLFHSVYYQ
jgi:hypothetical protein